MTSLRWFCGLAAGLVFLLSCDEQEKKPDLVSLTESLEKKVEELRGLRFRKPVMKGIKNQEQMRALLQEKIYESTPPEKLRVYERVYQALGLLPEGFDYEKGILDYLAVGVGGLYDPKAKTFYLAEGMPVSLQKTVIVHEMTHALDDQYFNLDKFMDPTLSEDHGLGIAAVVEGSAMLVMNLYQQRTPGSMREMLDEGEEIARFAADQTRALAAMPPYIIRALLCGYTEGSVFLAPQGLSDAERAERVLQAFQSPPRSSEQVLHPEKYWDPEKSDEPMRVSLPDLTAALGEGWKKTGEDTLGELNVATLTQDPDAAIDFSNPAALAQIAWTNEEASGWGGDRWAIYEKNGETAVFWLIAWDSAADAKEFLAAYRPPTAASRVLLQDGVRTLVAVAKKNPGIDAAARKALEESKIERSKKP